MLVDLCAANALTCPGVDGLTTDVVLRGYPQAAANGLVAGPVTLGYLHEVPQLVRQLRFGGRGCRVLREQELTYGLLRNAFELRLVCTAEALQSHIGFDLTAIAEGG